MHRSLSAIFAGVAGSAIAFPMTSVAQNDGFIFSGDRVVSAADQKQFISVGEKLSIPQLKKRFPSYTVTREQGEGCGDICVTIKGKKDTYILISYDRSSDDYRISSDAHSSRDTLGSTIGTPLRKAVGANTTKCDRGSEITCESALIKGLSYTVTNGCDWKTTVIPACAKVEGFEIYRFQQQR
jgi:hypothetical protein